MAIATPQHLSQTTALYTALFNRAPDTAGLAFWSNALANGASSSTVTQGFLTAPEGAVNYPAFQTADQFVNAFYTKVFGRAPDAGGLAFWTTALNNAGGAESTAAKASLVSQIVSVVNTPLTAKPEGFSDAEYAQSLADRATFANKLDVGQYFATNFPVDEAAAKTVLNGVDNTADSVIAAKGRAFDTALTSGATNITGTDGNDVFSATLANVINGDRTIDGGAGDDTLAIDAASAGVLLEGKVKNVEAVNIATASNVNSGTIAVDKVFADARSINLTGATGGTGVTLTGAAGKTIGLLGTGAAIVDFGTATAADVVVQSTDPAGTSLQVAGASLATLNVSGAGRVDLTQADAALKTVKLDANGVAPLAVATGSLTDVTLDASASKGAVQAEVGANVAYKGGAAVDTVTIGAAPAKLLDGGAGDADVLRIASDSDVLVASAGNVSNFETISIGKDNTGTYNASAFKNILLDQGAGATVFNNVAAGTTLTISSATQNATVNLADRAGNNDALKINVASTAALDAGTVTAEGVETINIASTSTATDAATASNTLGLTAVGATSVVVTGNTGLTLLGDAGNTKITNVDASASTGGLNYVSQNATVGATVTIKGSATAGNTLEGGVTNDTITGGAGTDTINGKSGLDTLTGGAGNDTFKLGINANSQSYATITDFAKGDVLDMTEAGFVAGSAGSTALTQVTLASTASLQQYVDAAASVNAAGADGAAGWFQFSGDTYVVVDNTSAANTFTNGADQLVKLTGTVDLSTAAITDHLLTVV